MTERHAFLALLAATTLLLGACGDRSAADSESTASPTGNDDTLSSSLVAYDGLPIGGRFLDADDGALVRAHCGADSCSYQLLRTSDGGRSWVASTVPGDPVTSTPLDDAYAVVLPGGQVVTEIQVDADRPARLTTDGKTWPAHSAQPLGVTKVVPANSALVGWCSQDVDCAEPFLRVIGPNGSSKSFGPPPPQLTETISATRVAEGSLWIQGRDGVGRIVLAVSRNEGRNWTVNRVPAPSASSVDLAGAGEVAWALSLADPDVSGGTGGTAPSENTRRTRQSLLHSTNSGSSFDSVKLPEEYRVNTGSGVAVTDSGDAVIASEGRVAVVSPGGELTPVTQVSGAVYDLGARVLVYGPKGSWVSADGKTWSPLPKA
ncbi:hypothetical protein [Cryptosporangium arvum]|uniref:hypothetical protein n=1 Tax=Cryptosporangium arvum TaxID=80871 RepID=UPI0004B18EB8|nr:hypothetical protein [Cryptosporangium arvum]